MAGPESTIHRQFLRPLNHVCVRGEEVMLYPAHLADGDVSFVIISCHMPPHGCLDNEDLAFAFLFSCFTFDDI